MAYLGLIVVFVLEYLRPGNSMPFIDAIKLGTVLPILVFLSSLFINSRINNSDVLQSGNTKLLIYFMFIIVFSMLIMGGPTGDDRFRQALGYFFIYYSIARICDSKRKLEGLFITLGLMHVVLIWLNPKLILEPETRSYIGGGVTFLGDGNDFALSLCIVFPLVAYLFLEAKQKYLRILFLVIAGVSVLGIIGTQSRGASLALGSMLLYLWLKGRKKILGLFALVVLVVAALLFASPQYFVRMGTLSNYETEGSAQGRINAWGSGLDMARVNPITGVGPGNYPYHNRGATAHSMYFLALGELGLPGAIFILSYVISNFRRNRQQLKRMSPQTELEYSYQKLFIYMNASFLGLTVAGTFLSALYYPHLYVVGGMLLAAHQLYAIEEKSGAFNDLSKVERIKDSEGGRKENT